MLTVIPDHLQVLPDTDPRLREVSEPVEEITSEVVALASKMYDIVEGRRALGLAAIQVGVPLRMIIARLDRGVTIMVNPILVRTLNREVVEREGCLSVRSEWWRKVSRPAKCEVKWANIDGTVHQENFAGMDARIIQHECDHLDGVLIIDKPGVFQ